MHDVLLELKWIAEGGSKAGVPAMIGARRKGTMRLAWTVAGAAATAAVAFGVGYWVNRPPKPESVKFEIPAPAGVTGVGSPKISPDGRLLAFDAGDSTGTAKIWIRPLNALTAQPLAGTDGTRRPFWSPDSRQVAFFAGGKLRKIAVTGAPPQTICESVNGADGSWSPKGVILYDGGAGDAICRVSAAGGAPAPATFIDRGRGEVGHAWPQFLPDGNHFIYLASGGGPDTTWIKVGSLDSRESKVLAAGKFSRVEYAPPGYLIFSREGALMAQPCDVSALKLTGEAFPLVDAVFADAAGVGNAEFSASRTGVMTLRSGAGGGSRLTWVDRTGKELGTLAKGIAAFAGIAVSPDGGRIAVSQGASSSNVDIWTLEQSRGVASRFTTDPALEIWPVWSPDGAWIAYGSNKKGPFYVCRKRSDGEGDEEQFATGANLAPWIGHPMGSSSRAPGSRTQGTRWDIFVVPLEGIGSRSPSCKRRSWSFTPASRRTGAGSCTPLMSRGGGRST
jgi:WD40 repeat protein